MHKTEHYTAKTFFGLEEILAKEIQQLGGTEIKKGVRSVSFKGDLATLYKCNLWSRTAIKILKPIHHFRASNEEQLYKACQLVNWTEMFRLDQTFAVESTVKSTHFKHSKYVALKVKDAIADQFREVFDQRPNVDTENPDFRVNIYINKEDCILSLDSSGIPLHRRGYIQTRTSAPLNEVLAAGMVLLSDWDTNSHFIDPMCGSGTILIEAAMYALNIAPGIFRKHFAFMNWEDFDKKLWSSLVEEAQKAQKKRFAYKIEGSDISRKACRAAIENVQAAKLEGFIRISPQAVKEKIPPQDNGLLITNPPYGERLQPEELENLYKSIGDTLKQKYSGYDAWVLSSNKEALKCIGLRASKKLTLYNGALVCKFQQYKMYKGSKK
ncbi:THUMP domain-containing protein [Rapidithrix thailandica]|uniref:THUMP domain-containing protein n=1 Tax=Rapidithrix thailandica TaxID=413964 RepID=A0AAW9SDP5_9BACT